MSSETVVQQRVMMELASIGQAWRNNVGACEDKSGRQIRYGLANTSAAMNRQIKSSDVIGITPEDVFIMRLNCFARVGVFTAIECKRPDWHMTPGDDRAIAQEKFMSLVREQGGYAGFATDAADVARIIRR